MNFSLFYSVILPSVFSVLFFFSLWCTMHVIVHVHGYTPVHVHVDVHAY